MTRPSADESHEVVLVVRSLRRRPGEPLRFEATNRDDPSAPAIAFDVEERHGRPEVVTMTFTASSRRGRGLRTADLARVNVDRLIRVAFEAAGGPRVGEAAYRAATRPGRPRTIDRDRLEAVARVYRENADHKPRVAVAETWDVSHRTASNWIKAATEEGLLP